MRVADKLKKAARAVTERVGTGRKTSQAPSSEQGSSPGGPGKDGRPAAGNAGGAAKKPFDQELDTVPSLRTPFMERIKGLFARWTAGARRVRSGEPGRIPRPIRVAFAWLIVAIGVLFLVGAGWELAASGRIERGVTINGVEVGGMTREQAREAASGTVKPLEGDMRLMFEGKEYAVGMEEIGLRIDLDGMVQQAYRAGKGSAGLLRVFRRLAGISLAEDVGVKVAVKKAWLNNRLLGIAREIDREPVSARVTVASGSPEIIPSKDGVTMRVDATADAVVKVLGRPVREMDVIVVLRKPEVVEADISKIVWVRQKEFRLYLFERTEEIDSFPVAVGMPQYPTPNGRFHVTYKERNPTWLPTSEWAKDKQGIPQPPGPDNPLGGYWMDIGQGLGIHATPFRKSLGEQASHGCIRMLEEDAAALFNAVNVGTPVFITD